MKNIWEVYFIYKAISPENKISDQLQKIVSYCIALIPVIARQSAYFGENYLAQESDF